MKTGILPPHGHRLLQVCLLVFCGCLPALPQARENTIGERLLVSPPADWRLAYRDQQYNVDTSEYVPSGQELGSWKELITVQIMHGMENTDPEDYLGKMVTRAEKSCDYLLGVKVIPFALKSEYPTRGIIQGCGRSEETSQGEFKIIRAISGKDNLYLIQKAWRLPVWKSSENPALNDDDILKWIDYLALARVCDTRRRTCPDGKGTP